MYQFLLLSNFAVWAGIAIYFVSRPYSSVYHPLTFYLLFHLVVFVIRPIVSWIGGYYLIYGAYKFNPSPGDKELAVICTIVGLVAFASACLGKANMPLLNRRDRFEAAQMKLLLNPFLITAMLCGPLALYSAVSAWGAAASDLSVVTMDQGTGVAISTNTTGYLVDAQLMLAPLSLLFAWLNRFRWWSLMPLVAFIVLRSGTGGRGPFVLAAVSLALLYLFEKGKRWPDMKNVAIIAGVAVLFNVVGSDRGASIRRLFIQDNTYQYQFNRIDLRFMEGMDLANMDFLEYLTYAVPGRTGTYGYFLDNLQIFTEPVPRIFWPGKPIGPPIKMYNLFDYGYPIGMTYSLPGEGYQQLGLIGVMIWCGLFGYVYGVAYAKFAKSRQTNFQTVAYCFFVPISILFFRDGLLLTILKAGLFLFLPLGVLYLLTRTAGLPTSDDLRMMTARRIGRGKPVRSPKILARERAARRSRRRLPAPAE